jgi:hypothetical protein
METGAPSWQILFGFWQCYSPFNWPFDGCFYYQIGARVGFKCILRVMPLSSSFGIRVGLKGLEMVMPMPMLSVLVFLLLYAAPIERTGSFFYQFPTACLYLLHRYLCFGSDVVEPTPSCRSSTISSFWIKIEKNPLLSPFLHFN